jgi:urea transporter
MWFFNALSYMGRIFSTEEELKKFLFPLKLVATENSNYLYFFNKPLDLLGKVFGVGIYRKTDRLLQVLGVPPSTKTFIFKKS